MAEKRWVFYASGNTFAYKEKFKSWAWYWNAEKRCWINDNGIEPGEPEVAWAYRLPGVNVLERHLDINREA